MSKQILTTPIFCPLCDNIVKYIENGNWTLCSNCQKWSVRNLPERLVSNPLKQSGWQEMYSFSSENIMVHYSKNLNESTVYLNKSMAPVYCFIGKTYDIKKIKLWLNFL